MTQTQTASEQITEEVTSWPGVTAGPGDRGSFPSGWGAGSSVTCTATTCSISASRRPSGTSCTIRAVSTTTRSSPEARICRAEDREWRGRARRDRAPADQLRARALAARPARLGLRAMEELIDRLRAALAEAGLERAVLSHPETLAHLCLFDPSLEEWPVANPFVASPALLVLDADAATLLVASFHAAHAARSPVPVEQYRSVRLRAGARSRGGAGSGDARPGRRPGPDRRRGLVAARRGRRRAPGRGRRAGRGRRSWSCEHGASSSRSSSRPSGAPRGSPTSCRAPSRTSPSPA